MRKTIESLQADGKKKRPAIQGRKGQKKGTTGNAGVNTRRKPYYMYQDRCGNDLGGRG